MYEEYLMHHGVKGMKWGVRKTPEEKAARRREKILKSPRRLKRHQKEFSKAEIDNALQKMNLNRQLDQLQRDKITSGKNKADAILSYAKLIGVTAATAGVGIAVYQAAKNKNYEEVIKALGKLGR